MNVEKWINYINTEDTDKLQTTLKGLELVLSNPIIEREFKGEGLNLLAILINQELTKRGVL